MLFVDIPQDEADNLMAMEKYCIEEKGWEYPGSDGKLSIPLVSKNHSEKFMLDLSRGRIALSKNTFQNRARVGIVLYRLDIGGPRHRNPDGEIILCPHLHYYKEGFGDKWAKSISKEDFTDVNDIQMTINQFMSYCNITQPPKFIWGLFP